MSLKTLDNSLELLKYFTKQTPAWGVRELAKEMNISHSIVYRILSTFENHGFLFQNPETKKYELGIRFLEYGQIVKEKIHLSDMIFPVMKRLSEQTGESVFLTWLDGSEGVCVEIAESKQTIKYMVTVGSRSPLYAGSNKVMMAYLSKEKQLAIIEKGLRSFTDKTITDAKQLLQVLDEVKAKRWCLSVGEYTEATFGLAVPLFNHKQEIIASLAIGGPEYRLPEEKVQETLALLQKDAAEIQMYLQQYSLSY